MFTILSVCTFEDENAGIVIATESANAVWSIDTIEIIHLRIYVDK